MESFFLRHPFLSTYGAILGFAGVVIAIIVLIAIPVTNNAMESQCQSYSNQTGRKTKMGGGYFNRTCYVKMSTGWYDINQIRSEGQ